MFLLVSQSSLALLLPLLTLSPPSCLFVCVFLATLAPFSSLLEQLQQILWHFGAQNSERTTANTICVLLNFMELDAARLATQYAAGCQIQAASFFSFKTWLSLSLCVSSNYTNSKPDRQPSVKTAKGPWTSNLGKAYFPWQWTWKRKWRRW